MCVCPQALVENMSVKGKSMECVQYVSVCYIIIHVHVRRSPSHCMLLLLLIRYQQTLHRNLVYLATLADPSVNVQALLPVR